MRVRFRQLPSFVICLITYSVFLGCSLLLLPMTAFAKPAPENKFVTYADFGAKGDGITDDLPAICAAHEYANEHKLPVKSDPEATYHLGRQALTAIIETNTDWSTSRFIIDDSQGVEDNKKELFKVRTSHESFPIEIKKLKKNQKSLDIQLAQDSLVFVEDAEIRRYIRRGLNPNEGVLQSEAFILRTDGTIEGDIEWDYQEISSAVAQPLDQEPLVLQGGYFIHIANRMKQEVGYNYWHRNIVIKRSNTIVREVSYEVTGETDFGHPYTGFLYAVDSANIRFQDCSVGGHKFYWTMGRAGKPVPMGTYGYQAKRVVNFSMVGCKMRDIHDTSRWGVVATNFVKNLLVDDCVLSRVDTHMGASGYYIIRNSTIGHAGINAIGMGLLKIENTTVYDERFITFRKDYGSTWDGELIIENCRWILPEQLESEDLFMLHFNNDGTQDMGYACTMPRTITIDGLMVDDMLLPEKLRGFTILRDPIGPPLASRPHPYKLAEKLEIKGLTITSGTPAKITNNPTMAESLEIVIGDESMVEDR